MRTNNLFNINRFGLLIRQNLIHNYKLISLSLAGLCGGIFILLFLVQTANDFRGWQHDELFGTFMFLFIAVGIIYTGTSFPGLRTREKSFSFLLNPVSAFEKYVFEFLSRIVLFIIVMPIIFWLVYLTEGFFAELIIPDYDFVPVSFLWNGFSEIEPAEYYGWVVMLVTSLTLLIFNIPFTGATIFTKYPLLKTLFAIAVIFFFHAFLIFFFVEILNFKDYGHSHMSILGIKDAFGALKFFTIYSIIVNAGLIATAYLKLKEKEV